MKNITTILIAGAFFMASCGPARVIQTESYQPAPEPVAPPVVSYQSFYDDLAPYGTWVNYPGYGYVWMPNAGPDFMPYNTNGNWIYTDAGWTWASNYSWGWAPFHYGRWFYEGGYGWMWIPGNEWAPAWVSWRGGNDYYGWAPLGPNVSIDVAMGSYNPPVNYWNFVPRRYMGNPGWHNYYVNQSRNVTIINNTTIINNYSGTDRARYAYAPGPDPNEVRRVSGANFQQVHIREANTPGSRVNGNQYDIYRPRIDATPSNRTNASARPAPARVQNMRDLRPQTPDPGNNTRPSVQNPNNNNGRPATLPSNNTRPATQPAVQNPVNNNPRPETRLPVQNPVNNNGRPATQSADSRFNQRPATQFPAQNPVNNNGRPAMQPVNDPRPEMRPASGNANPATTGRPADSRFNQTSAGPRSAQQPRSIPQPSPVNRAQMRTQPAPNTQNNRTQPVRQATRPQQRSSPVIRRTDEKKTPEKPVTREAN